MTNDKSIMSVAEAYKAMVNPPKAERPSWVPASIAEEKVHAFVEATKTARAEKQEIFEFEEKKYKISIKEELKDGQKKLDEAGIPTDESVNEAKVVINRSVPDEDRKAHADSMNKTFGIDVNFKDNSVVYSGSPESLKKAVLKAYGGDVVKATKDHPHIFTKEENESVNEAATKKAKHGSSPEGQEKLEPRAKGEKEFADAHEVEVKDGVPETSQDGSADIEEAGDNEPTDKSEKNNIEVALEPEEKAQTGAEKLNTAKQ